MCARVWVSTRLCRYVVLLRVQMILSYRSILPMIALSNRHDGFFDLGTKRQRPKPTYNMRSPKPQP